MQKRNLHFFKSCKNKNMVADSIVGMLKLKYDHNYSNISDKTRKTELQTNVLTKIFLISNFPSSETREEIAILLGLSLRSVQIWFQNRRQASRRQIKEKIKKKHHSEHHKSPKYLHTHAFFIDNDEIPTKELINIVLETLLEQNIDRNE